MKRKITKILLFSVLGLTFLCAGVIGFLALSNKGLPTHSKVTERLSDLEKARLAEAAHLRQSLGNEVWPGWGEADIPFIVYNEEYAFLVGYPDPPYGWVKVPQDISRGEAWEPVPDDTFFGETYYRQALSDPEVTPEAFTVLVGDRWVATMQTKEYALVYFVSGLREQLPPFLSPVFPYRFMFAQLMGETENYLGGLEHKSFHAYQGGALPERLEAAERAMGVDERYPWGDNALEDAWHGELDLLLAAVRSESNDEAALNARQFIYQRDQRRRAAGLAEEMIDFERQREWLEGLAKYIEVEIGLAAQEAGDYLPEEAIQSDPDFNGYRTRRRYWQRQMDEVQRLSGRGGDTRFYYSGMAQAVLLDRLLPGWKQAAFEPGVMLEDLLRQAVE